MTVFRALRVLLGMLVLTMPLATPLAAQDGYRIKPGDVLQIEVLEDSSLNRNALVLPDGRFSFPYAGTVSAAGRTVSEVTGAIRTAIAGNFAAAPNIFVAVQPGEPRARSGRSAVPATIDIFFVGEVNGPGQKAVKRGTTFLQAIAQSGGFSKFAAQKRVQLRRTDPKTGQQTLYHVDYRALSNGAKMAHDIILQDGDVILVPERRLFE